MNELQIVVEQEPGFIRMNDEAVKAAVCERVAGYDTAIVTEESKTIMKGELASLRKFKKTIEDRRKEVKTTWMAPYLEFEARTKALVAIIDDPIENIDSQIKAFDEAARQKKRKQIRIKFAELAAPVADYLTLDKIYDPKWENATTRMSKVSEDIQKYVDSVSKDIMSISKMQSEAVPEALNRYRNTLNMADAMLYINQYETQKATIVQREREREIERIRQEERRRVAEEQKIREDAQKEIVQELTAPISDEVVKDAIVTAIYTLSASEEALEELETILDSLGITWSRKM